MSMDKENTFYVLDKNGEFQEIGQMDSLPDVGDHTSDARRMLENPLKPDKRRATRIRTFEDMVTVVLDWVHDTTAPWNHHKAEPTNDGEVCTAVSMDTKTIHSDGDKVTVTFTRTVKVGEEDVITLSQTDVVLTYREYAPIKVALVWREKGSTDLALNATLAHARVHDNNRALTRVLDQVHRFVSTAHCVAGEAESHAWKVSRQAANMMEQGILHGETIPSYVESFTGVMWMPVHWRVMLAVLKDAIGVQVGRTRGLMKSVPIDNPQLPSHVGDPEKAPMSLTQVVGVGDYETMNITVTPTHEREITSTPGLYDISITATSCGSTFIAPILQLYRTRMTVGDVFSLLHAAGIFFTVAHHMDAVDRPTFTVEFKVDAEWVKRALYMDVDTDDAQEGSEDE